MQTTDQPGDIIPMAEIWWALVLDTNQPGGSLPQKRHYLADPAPSGGRLVIEDVQRSSFIPMIVVNLEQTEAILDRFKLAKFHGQILKTGATHDDFWLVWMDTGEQGGIIEKWVHTADEEEAERVASDRMPLAKAVLKASAADLMHVRDTLRRVSAGWWYPVWLDLRSPPKHLSAAELMKRKIDSEYGNTVV